MAKNKSTTVTSTYKGYKDSVYRVASATNNKFWTVSFYSINNQPVGLLNFN